MADDLAALVTKCEAAGEAVAAAKRTGDKPEIERKVKALVELKEAITEIDPTHPLAIVDKKAKKAAEKAKKAGGGAPAAAAPAAAPAAGAPLSKNAQKALAKKQAKEARVAAAKKAKAEETGAIAKAKAKPAPAPAASKPAAPAAGGDDGTVYFGADRPPLAAMAANHLFKGKLAFAVDPSLKAAQPYVVLAGARAHGEATVARHACRAAGAAVDPADGALVDQWVELSGSYPARGDVAGFVSVLEARLADATWLVGEACTLADAACWAALQHEKAAKPSRNVARWLRLCEGQPAFVAAKRTAKSAPTSKGAAAGDGCPPLDGAVEGEVVTRFPPEPSGYLHIGHAKAVLLNDYYAKRYKGKLLVRFDDTNPSKEKGEYAANILRDLETLGINVEEKGEGSYCKLSHTSDHFDLLRKKAEELIKGGGAFMDDTPQEAMKKEREERVNSKHRDADVETNLAKFKELCAGKADEWCLRAKIDMTSDNGTLRDPVLFRANQDAHHRTGVKYKAYPTYDFACPIVDSVEGVTHALRTTEYNDRDAQYAWIQNAMKVRKVKIHAFARINFVRTLMSKRKLAWLVDQKAVEGWDDPRFPTIQGVARRGVSMASLRDFIVSQGASRNVVNLEWDSFWAINKAAYEPTAMRLMAVETKGRAVLWLTNVPEYFDDGVHAEVCPKVPKDPEAGKRPIRVSRKIYLEGDDAATLEAGEEVVLQRWGLVKLTKVDGLELTGEFLRDSTDFKKKKALSWLAASPVDHPEYPEWGDLVPCTLVEYDYLLAKPKLEESDELDEPGVMTPVSKVETPAWADPMLKLVSHNDVIQLERRGFFRVDVPWRPKKAPDGTVTYQDPVLIYIPDGKPQHKVPFSRLPSAAK